LTKITLIGAGSTVFAQNILGDILSRPAFGNCSIALHDIDADRLSTSCIVTERICAKLNLSHVKIEATTDLTSALRGARFVILMFQVGGYRPSTVIDFDIPKKYGLRQTIGDTLGIGGIFRALRTIPILQKIGEEMRQICPDALLMNYVNPMAINCWALSKLVPEIKTVGLCHSVQHTAQHLARCLGEKIDDIDYLCAGINHVAFMLKFGKYHDDGSFEDLYPHLKALEQQGRIPDNDRVRFDVLKRFGYFVTESSEHFAEYVPWYIKNGHEDMIKALNIPLDEYPRRCEENLKDWAQMRANLEGNKPIEVCRSDEYASAILNAMVTGKPELIYGNVPNSGGGLIANLATDAIVEVPCHVDRNGIQPIHMGKLPAELTAVINMSIHVQELTVLAALTGKRHYIEQAAMLDPHTASELTPDQIGALVGDMIEAHGSMLPTFI